MSMLGKRGGAGPMAVLIAVAIMGSSGRPSASHAQPSSARDSASAAPADTVLQRDIMDVLSMLLGRTDQPAAAVPPRRGITRSLLPSLGYNPNAGLSVGASIGLGGWLGDPTTTRLSSGILSASYSTEGQTSVQFKSNFNLSHNEWVLLGDWRYLNTNQPTYGLGPTVPGQSEYPMKFMLYRIHEVATHRLSDSPASVGLGYHFDHYADIRDTRAAQGESTPYSAYNEGAVPTHSQSAGLSLDLILDTRDNQINARRGTFLNVSMQTYQPAFGSDASREAVWIDFRRYTPLPPGNRHTLATWVYIWMMSGSTPYLDLPAIGWDTYGRSGRGYIQGRMRGAHQAYGEVEYRMRLSKDGLVGAVGFLNLTGTGLAQGGLVGSADLGFGGGLRIKLNKRTDSNVSLDIGRGDDRATHVFVAMQEAY